MGKIADAALEFGPEVVEYLSQFAKRRQTVTYGTLNTFIESVRGTRLANTDVGGFVGSLQEVLYRINPAWPFLNLIVVSKEGLVGKGALYHVRLKHKRVMFRSPNFEQAVLGEQEEVFDWEDWNSIIEALKSLKIAKREKILDREINDDDDYDDGNDYYTDARIRIEQEIVARQGQGPFRSNLLLAYKSKCAVTGTDFHPVLEAAHIVPYMGSSSNDLENGMLLRADIHTLFDRGHLGVDPDQWVVVLGTALSGTSYERLAGTRFSLPDDRQLWPSEELLKRHLALWGLAARKGPH